MENALHKTDLFRKNVTDECQLITGWRYNYDSSVLGLMMV